ncbi:MAG: UvrD-helicase domain-containing protein [Vulcanibacillus sp.]
MSNLPLSDQEDRDTITNIFDKNFLVEAGAGSGKTTYLVRRMIETVREGRCKIEEIAAITFTRKAASELRERFQTKLEKTYEDTTDKMERKILEEALQNIDQSFIGTVHSFCGRLLRERPVEAGIDPEFKELDNIDLALLERQAWKEYLLKLKLENSILLSNLEKIGILPEDLYRSFQDLNNYSDVDLVKEKRDRPDIEKALVEVLKFVERARHSIPVQPVDEKGYDDLQKAIKKTTRLNSYLNPNKDINIIKIISIYEKDLGITQKRWTSKEEAKDFKEEADILREEIIQPIMKTWREYSHFYILEFLVPAVKYYEELRSKLSSLNFQDLLIKTADMLKNNPEIRKYFQNKYKSLLVDEFQDTDPIQAEIVFYLTGADSEEKDWQKLVPLPGTLFVVGDPKQSIYRFRRADIDIYNLVKKLIQVSGGEVLKLTSNFRSLNSIGNYLNPIFQEIFPGKSDKYQAEFAAMDTVKEDEVGISSGVKCLQISSEYKNKDGVVNSDADSIAKIIRDAVDGNMMLHKTAKPTYKDFMILLRYKDSMEVYTRTLETYGIPVKMAGSSTVGESIEVKELLKLLKLLSNIDNQVLLIAVLRGLFFGLSENLLYKFKCAGGQFNIFTKMPESLEENHRSELDNVLKKLNEYYLWTRKYNPTNVIEKIISDIGIVPYIARGEMNMSRYGSIYYILERLRKSESEGVTEFSIIVKQFETILETNIEEELDIFCEEDTVRIMNLHKAKGLEAPVVFLAHPAKMTKVSPALHIERTNNQPKGYFMFSKSTGEFSSISIGEPKDWNIYQEEEERYLQAEEKRLVYVAATRAKNLLIISNSQLKNKNPWELLLKNLKKSDEIIVPDIQQRVVLAEDSQTINIDDYKRIKSECENWQNELSTKGYLTAAPTDYKDASKFWSISREDGGGLAWGNAVHRTLEYLVKDNGNIEAIVESALMEYDVSLERKNELISLVDKFKQSAIWVRIEKAEAKFAEVPFSIKVDNQHSIFELIKLDGDIPIILTGTIDLLFKEDGEWVVVDYKTDHATTEDDYNKLREIYKTQTKIYSFVIEELLGEKVKSEEIVFL